MFAFFHHSRIFYTALTSTVFTVPFLSLFFNIIYRVYLWYEWKIYIKSKVVFVDSNFLITLMYVYIFKFIKIYKYFENNIYYFVK